MIELQASLGFDDTENTLQSIVRGSGAYLIIKNGRCDFELSSVPAGLNIFDGIKEKDFVASVLTKEFEYTVKDDQSYNLLIECSSTLSLDDPLYMIFLDTDQIKQEKIYRNFYLLREGARVAIIEKQITDLKETKKQTINIFSRWFLENNSALTHYGLELPNRGPDCVINNSVVIRQMRNSSCSFFTFYWKDGITNNKVDVFLDGEFAACNLYSASLLFNSTIVNNDIKVNHNYPNCESCQIYKGVFNDSSRGHFNSLVCVNESAQKTSSTQQNNNIILSDYASVKSNPQLEIFADDVKCAHGSTIGQVDLSALFYLRSRGIGKEEGTAILLRGFLSDVFDEIVDLKLRQIVINEFHKILNIGHDCE